MMDRIYDLIEELKEATGLVEKQPEKKSCNIAAVIVTIFAIIGVIAAAVFVIYKYFGPEYFEDFEDDYEEDFDDDFFEDEEDDIEVPSKEE